MCIYLYYSVFVHRTLEHSPVEAVTAEVLGPESRTTMPLHTLGSDCIIMHIHDCVHV